MRDNTPQVVKTIKNLMNEVRDLESERPRFVYPFVTEVTKEILVDSAHMLPNHNAKCKQFHGHTYRVLVTLRARLFDKQGHTNEGMVLDFKELKEVLKREVDEPFDHNYSNDVMFEVVNDNIHLEPTKRLYTRTTAEQMSWWVFTRLYEEFEMGRNHDNIELSNHNDIEVVKVEVYETPTSKATARREYFNYQHLRNNLQGTAYPRVYGRPVGVTELCESCEEDPNFNDVGRQDD